MDDSHNEPDTPPIPEIPGRVRDAERRLKGQRVTLTPEQRDVVKRTVREVCAHCGWKLWHVEVRTNHVHAVVTADSKPEPIMNRWKSWATRRLVEAEFVTRGAPIGARHGSTRYLWDWVSVQGAIAYARDRQ